MGFDNAHAVKNSGSTWGAKAAKWLLITSTGCEPFAASVIRTWRFFLAISGLK